jgi:hypothetical protein
VRGASPSMEAGRRIHCRFPDRCCVRQHFLRASPRWIGQASVLRRARPPSSRSTAQTIQRCSGASPRVFQRRYHRPRSQQYCHRGSVLAPASTLFNYLLGLHGKTVQSVVERLASEWGSGLRSVSTDEFRELRAELGADDHDTGDRWVAIADSLATGKYTAVVALLIEQNRSGRWSFGCCSSSIRSKRPPFSKAKSQPWGGRSPRTSQSKKPNSGSVTTPNECTSFAGRRHPVHVLRAARI